MVQLRRNLYLKIVEGCKGDPCADVWFGWHWTIAESWSRLATPGKGREDVVSMMWGVNFGVSHVIFELVLCVFL